MSDEQIKEHMIKFIIEKERDVVNDKLRGLSGDNKVKSDIVNSILTELNKEAPDEN